MSNAQHTPGPWRMNYRSNAFSGEWFDGVVGTDGQQIRVEGVTLTSSDEARANARLISAAPTMFDYIESSAANGCAEARKILEAIHGRA